VGLQECFQEAHHLFNAEKYLAAFDVIEYLLDSYPEHSIPLLARAYDLYQRLPDKESRYQLYQARQFDFHIEPGAKVLDIGSGHLPFAFATHLADLSLDDGRIGRAGAEFKVIDGKEVHECSVEALPFADKSFDFVYCSHVLEHVGSPEKACRELMRVGRRGYIETPNRGKDLWLHTARISNHRWAVEWINDTLEFTDYSASDLVGLSSDVLMQMHCAPQTDREKALSALIYLKAHHMNTMVAWEESFAFQVRRGRNSTIKNPDQER
jgi:SAM-dependent methyltransferase